MSDFGNRLEEARRRLPLRRLMEQYGKGPANGNWKDFPQCPICGKKRCSGVFAGGGGELFKCHHTSCPSGTQHDKSAWDEVSFVAYEHKVGRSEAAVLYLKQAGLWQDQQRTAPSVMPGKAGRRVPPPAGAPGGSHELRVSESVREEFQISDLRFENGENEHAEPREILNLPPTGQDSPGAEPSHDDGPPQSSEAGAAIPAEDPASDLTPRGEAPGPAGNVGHAASASAGASSAAPELTSAEARPFGGSDELRVSESVRGGQRTEGTEGNIIPLNAGTEGAAEKKISANKKISGDGSGGGGADGGGGGGGGDDGVEGGGAPLRSVLALRDFYGQLKLDEEDAKKLWKKRGLTLATCHELGFVSSSKSNREILEKMPERWPMNVLVDAGLWVRHDERGKPPEPNRQYYGYGVVRKKPPEERKHERDEWEWGWTHPILIPYFDARGELVDLRTHKRTQAGQQPRLYLPRKKGVGDGAKGRGEEGVSESVREESGSGRPVRKTKRLAIFTEGEFKAAALHQVFGGVDREVAVAALPGITMVKPLFGDIEDWAMDILEGSFPRRVVVGYDNEEKADPKLPGYKEEKWKRYDAEVWARLLCRRLNREGYDAKVAHLPNEWRDRKGKADWDGAMALLIAETWAKVKGELRVSESVRGEKEKEPDSESVRGGGAEITNAEVWAAVEPRVRQLFQEVLLGAVPENERGLFPEEAERVIASQVARYSYQKRLPDGGDDEEMWARRLVRLLAKSKDTDRLKASEAGFLRMLADKYRKTKGGYYILKPLKEQTQMIWQANRERARLKDDVEFKRACELALNGIPEWISDFTMEPLYVVHKTNDTRQRMVLLHSMHGVSSKLAALPSSAFAQPSKFREWLLDRIAGATWRAGERELNDLQADVCRDVIYKEVEEVPLRGYHKESGLWFFGDVAYAPDGRPVFADRNGIVWHKGQGYQLAQQDQEGQAFVQETPHMHPSRKVSREDLRALFQEIASKMAETAGGYAGYLALGAVLACGGAPEFFAAYSAFPSLWLHGEQSQGKSSFARWLIRLWGFERQSGLMLPDSTKVGVSVALHQYGNLPVWLEEFQPNCPPWMIEKLKGIYNRESGNKKTFDGELRREVKTGVIVTGVATSSNGQLRSRYCHVQVSSELRKANHYEWMEKESKERFYLIGRYILENRKEFSELMLKAMQGWLATKQLLDCDERTRIVHGASYSAFASLSTMLESHEAEDLRGFKAFLGTHAEKAQKDVHDQVYVNQFWTDIIAAVKAGEFGHTASERRRFFLAREDTGAVCPVKSEYQRQVAAEDSQKEWESVLLYFTPDVVDRLQVYKRRMNKEFELTKTDLSGQMRNRAYWVAPRSKYGHRQRFGPEQTNQYCYCVALDRHELGYHEVTDEEFSASLQGKRAGEFLSSAEWIDPRKGDLFWVVDMLKGKEE